MQRKWEKRISLICSLLDELLMNVRYSYSCYSWFFWNAFFYIIYINTYISISYIIFRRGCRYIFLIVTTVTVTLRYRLVVTHHSSSTRPSSAQGSYLLACSKGTSEDARSHKWQRKKPQVITQEGTSEDAKSHQWRCKKASFAIRLLLCRNIKNIIFIDFFCYKYCTIDFFC